MDLESGTSRSDSPADAAATASGASTGQDFPALHDNSWKRRQIWLPAGTKAGDQGPWLQRDPGTARILAEPLEVAAPTYADKVCRKKGAWLHVDRTKAGRLSVMGAAPAAQQTAPSKEQARALSDSCSRSRLTSHTSAAWQVSAIAAPRRPVALRKDRRAMVHVFVDDAQSNKLRLQVLPDGPTVDLVRAGPDGAAVHHWYTVEAIEFDAHGLQYELTLEAPAQGWSLSSLFSSSTSRKIKSPMLTGESGRLVHRFDPGFGDVATLPMDVRLERTLKSLIFYFPGDASSAVASLLSLGPSASIDWYDLLPRLLRWAQSAEQLVLCIQVLASVGWNIPAARPSLLAGLNKFDPPASAEVLTRVRHALRAWLQRAPPDDITWVAALRWSVDQPPPKPQPPVGSGASASFSASIQLASVSIGRIEFRSLARLLGKMLQAVPDLDALLVLLQIQWSYMVHQQYSQDISNAGTIAQMIDSAFAPPGATSQLRSDLSNTWQRMVGSLRLSELVQLHRKHSAVAEAAGAIRRQACRVASWDLYQPKLLHAIEELGIGKSQPWSTALLEDFLQHAHPTEHDDRYNVFPYLLAALPSVPPAQRTRAVVQWARSFVTAFERKGRGICQLYVSVFGSWDGWRAAPLEDAAKTLQEELLGMHRQKSCGGPLALLDGARLLGEDGALGAAFVQTELFTGCMLVALRDVLRAFVPSQATDLQWLQSGERSSRVLEALAPPLRSPLVPHAVSEVVLIELLNHLESATPCEPQPLLEALLGDSSADRALFWPPLLRAGGVSGQLKQHQLFIRVAAALSDLCASIPKRTIAVDVAEKVLDRS